MMQYFEWWGNHPWLGTFLLLLIGHVIVSIFRAIFGRSDEE